jgi:hypothetical protein
LESVWTWQKSFFYVRNLSPVDFINLPAYVPGIPSRANWGSIRRTPMLKLTGLSGPWGNSTRTLLLVRMISCAPLFRAGCCPFSAVLTR